MAWIFLERRGSVARLIGDEPLVYLMDMTKVYIRPESMWPIDGAGRKTMSFLGTELYGRVCSTKNELGEVRGVAH